MTPGTRDKQEHARIADILGNLPPDHLARIAYATGADTIRLTRLAPPEMVESLREAFLAGYRRSLDRQDGYFRP